MANEAGIEDERILIAAILHDTIEDTETTEQELIREFGKEVAGIVMEVTDDKALPKAERKQLQIEHAGTISRRAKVVKLADKICNLRDIVNSPPAGWSVGRKQEYFDWAKAVVDGFGACTQRLSIFSTKPTSSAQLRVGKGSHSPHCAPSDP